MIFGLSDSFRLFFKKNPALLVALFFLTGLAFAAKPVIAFLIPTILLFLPWIRSPLRLLPLLAIFLLAFFYGQISSEKFPKDKQAFEGIALFSASEIKSHKNHFKKSFSLKGTIKSMNGDHGEKASNISGSIPLPGNLRPLQFKEYLIRGTLEKTEGKTSFKPDSTKPWIGLGSSFCLPEYRFKTKEFLAKQLEKAYSSPKVSNFLIALILGDLSDELLRFSFGRLGLQHILAISGFHFGLLSLFIGFFFRLILKEKLALLGLLAALTAYFFLIGSSPSILRAYLAIVLYLIGRLGKWQTSSLNILGIVLLIELLLDPQCIKNLGFQLSFLATGSILILFPLTFSWMQKLFPKRSTEETLALNTPSKWIYLFCCFLRSTLALNLAVHLTVIPVCLFYFERFPLISCLYNLFIPLAVSLSLFLLLLSIPFFFLIPPLATFLTNLNEAFTGKILTILVEAPNRLDFYLNFSYLPEALLPSLLLGVFSLPLILSNRVKKPSS